MKKFTRKEVKELIKDMENNFSDLIDAVIYYDSIDKDSYAWDIISEIEDLPPSKEIEFLIKDLVKRNYEVSTNLLYNSLWYTQSNGEKNRQILIDLIAQNSNAKEIIRFLVPLNEGETQGDLNIQLVIDEVNTKIKKQKI